MGREMAGYVVLAPHGLPPDEGRREHCMDLLRRMGGDLTRVHASASSAEFERSVPRLERLFGKRTEALVLFTNTTPLSLTVLRDRRHIAQACPELRVAGWVIYVDPDRDPHFFDTASQCGTFDRSFDEAPIWRAAADGLEYVVLSPELKLPAGESLVGRIVTVQRARVRTSMKMLGVSAPVVDQACTVPPARW